MFVRVCIQALRNTKLCSRAFGDSHNFCRSYIANRWKSTMRTAPAVEVRISSLGSPRSSALGFGHKTYSFTPIICSRTVAHQLTRPWGTKSSRFLYMYIHTIFNTTSSERCRLGDLFTRPKLKNSFNKFSIIF